MNDKLAKIPGNGWKTVIGSLMLLMYAWLPDSGIMPDAPWVGLFYNLLQWGGTTFATIGSGHKVMKARAAKKLAAG